MGRKVNLRKKMAGDRTVDVYKSRRTTNIFFFFVAAAKASLFPFLTLYFRLLGLSATQTGILCGSKALMAMWTTPAWGNCAARFERRRCVLLFSVFLLIAVNLGLTLVPPVDKDESLMFCHHSNSTNNNEAANGTGLPFSTTPVAHTTEMPNTTSAHAPEVPITSTSSLPLTTELHTMPNANSVAPSAPPLPSGSTTSSSSQFTTRAGQLSKTTKRTAQLTTTTAAPSPRAKTSSASTAQSSSSESKPGEENTPRRIKRDVSDTFHSIGRSITTKLYAWKDQLYALEYRTFIIILVVILIGELLSSPVERIADDAWFDLLDNIDDLEKYGQHRTWASAAYVIYALAVAAVVDNTDCLLKFEINHFMIHFYVFAALMAMAFFTALFYPIYDTEKPRKRAAKGRLKVLCSDCRSGLYMLTAIVVGFVYASINCFLFWRVQDIGGTEIQMGTGFCVGALSEFIFLLFGHRFIQKIGNGYAICIGVLCLSIRLLYFSFLWTPWALVGVEVLSGFSGAGIWMALLSYHDFNINPRTGRGVATALQALYYGLGYAAGAMISGYAYDTFGLPIVYQGACIISFVWGVFFAIMNKCLPKRARVRYQKLLQDEDNFSDTSDAFEDDWLEMALKER